jgi:hypothetical protein
MTAASMLKMKQQLSKLTNKERQEVAAYLHRLKQETPAWKREMARRMREMDAGKGISLTSVLRRSRRGVV